MTGKSLTGIPLKREAIEPKVDSRVRPGVRRVKGTINKNGRKILLVLKAVPAILIASAIANMETMNRVIINNSNCLSIFINFEAMNVNTL
jgi:hypothetical protein